MQTYLFYDLETTGLNKAFDQILHFAAIRTDLNFNELDRYELKIKLNPDITPSPYAMLTHHMTLKEISEGLCEYDAIKQIHQWINTPGTISLGYNTLGFDDEFLRFSFYRNLLAPYSHQFANQCSRMDIYPIVIMYYLYKNNTLNWPTLNEKISFRLEHLNAANNFVEGRAHNAMVDVEATLALAKKLASEIEMWNYARDYFDKKIDADRIQKLASDDALLILGKFGFEKSFQSIVLSLGMHSHYKNQLLWLRLDDKDFQTLSKETILENTFVLQKKLGEPGFLLPLKERFMQHIKKENLELANSNKKWLQENSELFQFLSNHYREYKHPIVNDADIESTLYVNGFWSSQEEFFCKKFHAASPKEKSKLLETLQNPKLYSLALRILGKNFPDTLTPKQTEEFSSYLQKTRQTDAIVDFKGEKRLTPALALQQISELRINHQADNEKLQLLYEQEKYLLNFV